MTTFADIALPAFCAVFTTAMLAGIAWECRLIRRARKRRRANSPPLPPRRRLAYLLRLAWYKLTHRMPGRCPRRDRYRLSAGDSVTFGKLAGLYRQRGVYAEDPQRERRRLP